MHYEYVVNLKPVVHKPPKQIKEPAIRKSLVLAYQLQDYMSRHDMISLTELAAKTHITGSRITQITNMLYLSPRIQADIILASNKALFKMSERSIRHISRELSWPAQKKLWESTWNKYGESNA